jgi:hypothetical protein
VLLQEQSDKGLRKTNFSVPIPTTPGRGGFRPQLTLQYSSGNGNGPFGLGWGLSIPRITRKTEKGLPRYVDSDVFVMSEAEDLVPKLDPLPEEGVDPGGDVASGTDGAQCPDGSDGAPPGWRLDNFRNGPYCITRFRPRTEGLFARIERWTKREDGDVHWRAITRDNVTSIYGRRPEARIASHIQTPGKGLRMATRGDLRYRLGAPPGSLLLPRGRVPAPIAGARRAYRLLRLMSKQAQATVSGSRPGLCCSSTLMPRPRSAGDRASTRLFFAVPGSRL